MNRPANLHNRYSNPAAPFLVELRTPIPQHHPSAPLSTSNPAPTSRREFLGEALCLAACGAPASIAKAADPQTEKVPGTGGPAVAPDAITPTTVGEAAKIHAVRLTVAQREELAAAVPAQVKSVVELRGIPRPITLQPAIHFDPRIPGQPYPPQRNFVRLAGTPENSKRSTASSALPGGSLKRA